MKNTLRCDTQWQLLLSCWWKFFYSFTSVQFSSVAQVMSDSLRPHEPQHTRPPCPSPTPRVHPNPCPLSQWCHPTIPSSVVPFAFCPQSFPASGSFQMSQIFISGGQSCPEPAWGTPPMAKVMRKEARHTQRWDRASGVPLDILKHLPPKPESAYFMALCSHLWLYGGCPPPPSRSLW